MNNPLTPLKDLVADQKKSCPKRGFAIMDPARQREIAHLGGVAAHQKGTAHEFDSEQAREAGRKGGLVRAERIRARKAGGTPAV